MSDSKSDNKKFKPLTSKQLAKLLEQQRELSAKIQNLRRKDETRIKILHGVALLKAMEAGQVKEVYVKQILGKHITRPSDREFLGLEVKEAANGNNVQNTAHSNDSHSEPQHQQNQQHHEHHQHH